MPEPFELRRRAQQQQRDAARDDLERRDIEALGATRAELGSAYEPALLDNFADKVEAAIQRRMDAQLEHRRTDGIPVHREVFQFVLGIASIVAAIPISIVLGLNDHLIALIVAWAGIALVNIAHARSMRRH